MNLKINTLQCACICTVFIVFRFFFTVHIHCCRCDENQIVFFVVYIASIKTILPESNNDVEKLMFEGRFL